MGFRLIPAGAGVLKNWDVWTDAEWCIPAEAWAVGSTLYHGQLVGVRLDVRVLVSRSGLSCRYVSGYPGGFRVL